MKKFLAFSLITLFIIGLFFLLYNFFIAKKDASIQTAENKFISEKVTPVNAA